MVKVLYFIDRLLHGGIQTFVLENIKHMDLTKVHIDFLLLDDGKEYELENVFKEMGCSIYKLKNIWINNPISYISYIKALNTFFSNHNDYDVVHLHSSSKNFFVLLFAKKYGIHTRIAHSHNIGFQTKSKIQIIIGNLFKMPLIYYATDYFACSKLAGEWLFNKKICDNNLVVVKNAINIEKFCYDKNKDVYLRKRLGLTNKFVIGHVGRFTNQKNHSFLIDIFYEILKINPNSTLLLIGTGELENIIKEKVNNLGITDNVIFLGYKQNVSDYLQVMDAFVFPSNYEGLGLVLIEAQASGLACYTSKDVVPIEAKVSSLLKFISLQSPPCVWAKEICTYNPLSRCSPKDEILNLGYDINQTANFLQNFYLKRCKEKKL